MPARVRMEEGKLKSFSSRRKENSLAALPNTPKGSTLTLKRPFTVASLLAINVSLW